MSTVSDIIKRCLSLGDEQEWFEYKMGTAVSSADDVGEYISALSNAAQLADEPYGYLIWGIHNKTHELTGTNFNYQKDIHNEPFQHYLSRYVSPTIYFRFDEDVIESRQSVEVAIYKSYIDVYSPGTFPESVEPEMFIQKQMKPIRRNPLITTTLYYSKDMESFATGLKRINEECQKAGVKFEFIREPYGFTVRFHRHCGEAWRLADQHKDYHPGGDQGGNTGGETNVDWIARKEIILKEIRKEPTISTTRIADNLHLSRRQVEKILDMLKSEGRLHHEGSARSGHWVIDE